MVRPWTRSRQRRFRRHCGTTTTMSTNRSRILFGNSSTPRSLVKRRPRGKSQTREVCLPHWHYHGLLRQLQGQKEAPTDLEERIALELRPPELGISFNRPRKELGHLSRHISGTTFRGSIFRATALPPLSSPAYPEVDSWGVEGSRPWQLLEKRRGMTRR